MSDLKILTNNQYRFTMDWSDLTSKEQAEFDWLASRVLSQ